MHLCDRVGDVSDRGWSSREEGGGEIMQVRKRGKTVRQEVFIVNKQEEEVRETTTPQT